jgi:hypothetical protein
LSVSGFPGFLSFWNLETDKNQRKPGNFFAQLLMLTAFGGNSHFGQVPNSFKKFPQKLQKKFMWYITIAAALFELKG